MRVPLWLTLLVAAFVIFFGTYRIAMARRSDGDDARARARGGLYGMSRRTHFLVGTVYLLLGAGLVAGAFGWSPLAGLFGGKTQATAVPKSGIEVSK